VKLNLKKFFNGRTFFLLYKEKNFYWLISFEIKLKPRLEKNQTEIRDFQKNQTENQTEIKSLNFPNQTEKPNQDLGLVSSLILLRDKNPILLKNMFRF
jgi:hypothetical protein